MSAEETPDKPAGRRRKILPRLRRRERPANHVGLKPAEGWRERNFLSEIVWPSLFQKRHGMRLAPEFPKLSDGQISLTWIGHASFLLQSPDFNMLIDPNWARWLWSTGRVRAGRSC